MRSSSEAFKTKQYSYLIRNSSCKLSALLIMSFLAILVILTINFLMDGDTVKVMNYSHEKLNNFFIKIKSDSARHRVSTIYYLPLPLTKNSWTLIDIRRRSRRKTPYKIGVSVNTELDISDQNNIKASDANRTVQSSILVYNRVPKCGSTSIKRILKHLGRKNAFKYESSKIFWR